MTFAPQAAGYLNATRQAGEAGVTVQITIEDVADQIDAGYTEVQLHRASTVSGSYSEVDDATLDEDTYSYELTDASGDLTMWYKYRLSDGASTHSNFSNPFQLDGITRKMVRQHAIETYDAGKVLLSTSGGSGTSVLTTDYRIKGAGRDDRWKGNWLHVTTGTYVGETRQVTASVASTGALTIATLGAALTSGDEFELHKLADPDVWNAAINRACRRYHVLERVPIVGVAGQYEYSLDDLPWLQNPDDIKGLWHYPEDSDAGNDEPWSGQGRWWNYRDDGGAFTLMIKPATTSTLYLEAVRHIPTLHVDAAVAHRKANLTFLAALAYDEVLAYLSRPGNGASKDRQAYREMRIEHANQELNALLRRNRVIYRASPPVEVVPNRVPAPFSAR